MKKLIFVAMLPVVLSACAGMNTPPLAAGEPADAVKAKLGQPTGTYASGADTMLEYAGGPFGQYTHMARIGPDGKLISFEQVLSSEKFATVKPRKDSKQTILSTFGRPAQQVHYASVDGDVWVYRYKEQNVWDSVMHVEFDRNGIVQAMVNGPDPERESRRGR
ncbi:hypothetical protein Jab_2c18410 [Janthinobacterium sp. HH01]|nr:hypothetical protein Jab_2c18410 [Janthinobacterium sp. HH01]